jgi:predicted transcriptional regulator
MNKVFRFLRPSHETQLGPLERELLEKLWARESATVRELLSDGSMKLAYTTVMTTLDRLYKKHLLDRVNEGRAFRYWARHTQQDIEKAAAGDSIRQLLGSGPATLPLSYLVEVVSEHDVRLLDELQYVLDQKRRDLRERERIEEKEKEKEKRERP